MTAVSNWGCKHLVRVSYHPARWHWESRFAERVTLGPGTAARTVCLGDRGIELGPAADVPLWSDHAFGGDGLPICTAFIGFGASGGAETPRRTLSYGLWRITRSASA
jgi:hypothetical protein